MTSAGLTKSGQAAAGFLWQDIPDIIKLHLLSPISQEHLPSPQHRPRRPCHQQLLPRAQRCRRRGPTSAQAEEPCSAPSKTFRKELWRKHRRATTALPGSAEAAGPSRIQFPLPLLCWCCWPHLTRRTEQLQLPSPGSSFPSSSTALPELLCPAGISTPVFTWLQQLCSLATVSGAQQLLYSWIKKPWK